MKNDEGRSHFGGNKQRTPLLTIAAFALLLIIPVALLTGNIEVSNQRITIDLPAIDLNGEGQPDIDMGG